MTISEKVAYLKGLAEGLGIDSEKKEGKIIAAVIDVLTDMAEAIDELDENALDIGDELDALSDDLADVESFIYGDDDDDDEGDVCCCCGEEFDDDDDDFDDDGCSCCCAGGDDEDSCCAGHHDFDDFTYSITCPSCNSELAVDESILEAGSVTCPSCGEELEFEFDEDDEDEEEDGED